MVFFRKYVEVDDFSWTCPRFEFDAWQGPGHCYLRVEIKDRRAVFVCAELMNYRGADSGHGRFSIRERVLNFLMEQGVVRPIRQRTFLDKFRPGRFEDKQREDVIEYFNRFSVWIQHYPGDELDWKKSPYTVMNLRGTGRVLCNHRSEVIDRCRISAALLDISPDELNDERH